MSNGNGSQQVRERTRRQTSASTSYTKGQAVSDKIKHADEMTDAEIVAAVRGQSHALIPIVEDVCIGQFDFDTWEQFEGRMGVIMALTKDQCKFVAPQIFP